MMDSSQRQIIHVDMDAFYASVEQLDRPELRGQAVIVAGAADARGVVSSASYAARAFGVRSAMPTGRAVRLCPQAVVVAGRMQRYVDVSGQIREIFERYTPLVEPLSIDEAFLDVTGCGRLWGGACQIGRGIKQAIKDELGLTASLAVAPNKFLAKLGSDLRKPDGFVVITVDNQQEILDPLPVGRIWGIGKVTAGVLQERGIATIGDLRKRSVEELKAIVGDQAVGLLRLAQGVDDRPVETERETKSISSEHTFAEDVADKELLLGVLLTQVEQVGWRLRRHGLTARTVTLKVRYGDFRTLTRSKTIDEPTATTEILWRHVKRLFEAWSKRSFGALRLIGFGTSLLQEQGKGQQELFVDPQEDKQRQLDETLDAIRARFGSGAVRRHS